MLKNYLVITLRQFRKNQYFSLINVIGLAIGMSACMIIAHYVSFHTSFDRYHSNVHQIFRIERTVLKNGKVEGKTARVGSLLSQTLADQDPQVENFTRLYDINWQNSTLIHKSGTGIKAFDETGIYASDHSILKMFDFDIIAGNAERFEGPFKIVLTKSVAQRYFEDFGNAVGTSVLLSGNSGDYNYEVAAILQDPPPNSHLQFDILISFESLDEYIGGHKSWYAGDFFTYLLLSENANPDDILTYIYKLYEENVKERLNQYGWEVSEYRLISLPDIHLFSGVGTDISPTMDYELIYAMGGIAIIILVIAWINYLNLSFVKALDRLKEIGIRKVMGSQLRQIISLFMIEAILLNVISFFVALTLTQISAPYLATLTGIEIDLLANGFIVMGLFLLVIAGAILIGFYPALVFKTHQTTSILLGRETKIKYGRFGLQNILVMVQFVVTFLLVGITLTVYMQVNYMKDAELGFRLNDIMVINAPPGKISESDNSNRPDVVKYNAFKTELLKNSGIKMITNAGEIPGVEISWGAQLRLPNQGTEESVDFDLISMGVEFIDFFELKTTAGRSLRQGDDPWTRGDVVINERGAELLGFDQPEDAIGEKLEGFYSENPLVIRGIIENHHHNSLHYDYRPIAYILSSWTEFYFVKFDYTEDLNSVERKQRFDQLIGTVNSEWQKNFVDTPMDYFFLDQFYNKQYASDEQFGKIFGSFSTLAIIIACLGLFGLTSFSLQQRTKEIGIRKVLGASTSRLIFILARSYIIMILIAFIVATPIAWMGLERWLNNYSFRIEIGIWLAIIPLVVVIMISTLTILSRLMKSIRTNPVESLRYE